MADEGEWVDEEPTAQPQNEGEWVDEPQQAQAQPQDGGQWVDEKQGEQPEPEGALGSAVRAGAHAVIPTIAGAAGFGGGALLGNLPGGLLGGIGAASLAGMAQEKLLKTFGFDDEAQQAANRQAHPWATGFGEVAAAAPTFGVGAEAMLAQRALTAGIGGATDLIMGGDPQHAAAVAAGSAVLGKPTKLGESLIGAGETAGKKISSLLARSKADLEGAANITPTGATPDGAATKSKDADADALQNAVKTPDNSSTPGPRTPSGTAEEKSVPLTKGAAPSGDANNQVTESENQYGKAAAKEVSPSIQEEGKVPAEFQAALKTADTTPTPLEAPSKPADTTPAPAQLEPPEIAMLKQQAAQREAAANRTNNDVLKGPVLDEYAPGSPYEMARAGDLTADKAVEISNKLKENQGAIEDKIFGDKGIADKWRKLQRQSDIAWRRARDKQAHEFDEQIFELEKRANLTPKDEAFLNGEGPEYSDPQAWRDHAQDLRNLEGSRKDRVTALGYDLRRLPEEGKVRPEDHWTLAKVQYAMSEEAKAGGDPEALLRDAFNKSAERYGGGADAKEIVQDDMARLKHLMENPEPAPQALPLPPPRNEEGGTPSPELNEATRQAVETAGGGKPPPPPEEGGGKPPPLPPPPEGPNVTPAEKGGLSGLERGIKRIFAPTTLKGTGDLQKLARETGNEINSAHGKYNQIAQQGMKLLDPHRELVHNMPDQRLNQLVDRQMGGKAFPGFEPSPPEQRFMADLTKAFEQWKAPLAEHDPNQKFRENYLPGLYKNEDVARDFLRRWASKGDKGMTMEKQFPTYEEAKNAGMDPLTNNPIEMYTRYAMRARDFLAAEQFKKDQINKGFMRYFTEAPPGWERIRDTGQMDRPLYAPEDMAAVYNNYVDRGMRAQHEQLYNAVQHGANAWTTVELGLNGYHFVTMGHEGIAHDMTRAVGLAMSGKPAEATSTLLKAPLAPVLTYKAGSRAIADYLDPNHKSVAMDLMRDADVHFVGREHAADTMLSNRKSFLDLNSAESWKSQLNKAWKDVSNEFKDAKGVTAIAGSALKNAARAMQTFSHPLFDRYIPYMKAGATIKSVQDFLSTNEHLDLSNKNTPDYKFAVDQVRKIVNSVDNRFGEMISNHLFMNKTLQQSAQVAMRSFSWTAGAMKEIGGGTKSALGGIRPGEGNLAQKLDLKSEHYDPRVAYLIGFPAALAFTSAVTQFLATGQGPGELKDLALPKTGGTVPGYGGRGQVDERVVTPGYMKDVMGWVNHPFHEAYNKLNGLGTSVYETARGEDSFGRPIVNPKGSAMDQAKDRLTYFLSKMGPISYKNFIQGSKTGSHIPGWAAGAGFRAPSAEYQDPEGYKRGQNRQQQSSYDQRQRSLKRIERQYSP